MSSYLRFVLLFLFAIGLYAQQGEMERGIALLSSQDRAMISQGKEILSNLVLQGKLSQVVHSIQQDVFANLHVSNVSRIEAAHFLASRNALPILLRGMASISHDRLLPSWFGVLATARGHSAYHRLADSLSLAEQSLLLEGAFDHGLCQLQNPSVSSVLLENSVEIIVKLGLRSNPQDDGRLWQLIEHIALGSRISPADEIDPTLRLKVITKFLEKSYPHNSPVFFEKLVDLEKKLCKSAPHPLFLLQYRRLVCHLATPELALTVQDWPSLSRLVCLARSHWPQEGPAASDAKVPKKWLEKLTPAPDYDIFLHQAVVAKKAEELLNFLTHLYPFDPDRAKGMEEIFLSELTRGPTPLETKSPWVLDAVVYKKNLLETLGRIAEPSYGNFQELLQLADRHPELGQECFSALRSIFRYRAYEKKLEQPVEWDGKNMPARYAILRELQKRVDRGDSESTMLLGSFGFLEGIGSPDSLRILLETGLKTGAQRRALAELLEGVLRFSHPLDHVVSILESEPIQGIIQPQHAFAPEDSLKIRCAYAAGFMKNRRYPEARASLQTDPLSHGKARLALARILLEENGEEAVGRATLQVQNMPGGESDPEDAFHLAIVRILAAYRKGYRSHQGTLFAQAVQEYQDCERELEILSRSFSNLLGKKLRSLVLSARKFNPEFQLFSDGRFLSRQMLEQWVEKIPLQEKLQLLSARSSPLDARERYFIQEASYGLQICFQALGMKELASKNTTFFGYPENHTPVRTFDHYQHELDRELQFLQELENKVSSLQKQGIQGWNDKGAQEEMLAVLNHDIQRLDSAVQQARREVEIVCLQETSAIYDVNIAEIRIAYAELAKDVQALSLQQEKITQTILGKRRKIRENQQTIEQKKTEIAKLEVESQRILWVEARLLRSAQENKVAAEEHNKNAAKYNEQGKFAEAEAEKRRAEACEKAIGIAENRAEAEKWRQEARQHTVQSAQHVKEKAHLERELAADHVESQIQIIEALKNSIELRKKAIQHAQKMIPKIEEGVRKADEEVKKQLEKIEEQKRAAKKKNCWARIASITCKLVGTIVGCICGNPMLGYQVGSIVGSLVEAGITGNWKQGLLQASMQTVSSFLPGSGHLTSSVGVEGMAGVTLDIAISEGMKHLPKELNAGLILNGIMAIKSGNLKNFARDTSIQFFGRKLLDKGLQELSPKLREFLQENQIDSMIMSAIQAKAEGKNLSEVFTREKLQTTGINIAISALEKNPEIKKLLEKHNIPLRDLIKPEIFSKFPKNSQEIEKFIRELGMKPIAQKLLAEQLSNAMPEEWKSELQKIGMNPEAIVKRGLRGLESRDMKQVFTPEEMEKLGKQYAKVKLQELGYEVLGKIEQTRGYEEVRAFIKSVSGRDLDAVLKKGIQDFDWNTLQRMGPGIFQKVRQISLENISLEELKKLAEKFALRDSLPFDLLKDKIALFNESPEKTREILEKIMKTSLGKGENVEKAIALFMEHCVTEAGPKIQQELIPKLGQALAGLISDRSQEIGKLHAELLEMEKQFQNTGNPDLATLQMEFPAKRTELRKKIETEIKNRLKEEIGDTDNLFARQIVVQLSNQMIPAQGIEYIQKILEPYIEPIQKLQAEVQRLSESARTEDDLKHLRDKLSQLLRSANNPEWFASMSNKLSEEQARLSGEQERLKEVSKKFHIQDEEYKSKSQELEKEKDDLKAGEYEVRACALEHERALVLQEVQAEVIRAKISEWNAAIEKAKSQGSLVECEKLILEARRETEKAARVRVNQAVASVRIAELRQIIANYEEEMARLEEERQSLEIMKAEKGLEMKDYLRQIAEKERKKAELFLQEVHLQRNNMMERLHLAEKSLDFALARKRMLQTQVRVEPGLCDTLFTLNAMRSESVRRANYHLFMLKRIAETFGVQDTQSFPPDTCSKIQARSQRIRGALEVKNDKNLWTVSSHDVKIDGVKLDVFKKSGKVKFFVSPKDVEWPENREGIVLDVKVGIRFKPGTEPGNRQVFVIYEGAIEQVQKQMAEAKISRDMDFMDQESLMQERIPVKREFLPFQFTYRSPFASWSFRMGNAWTTEQRENLEGVMLRIYYLYSAGQK